MHNPSELGELERHGSLQRLYNVGVYGAKILVFAECLAFQGRKIFRFWVYVAAKVSIFMNLWWINCAKNPVIHAHIHSISSDKAEIPNAKFWPDVAVFLIMDYRIIGLKVKADIPNIFGLPQQLTNPSKNLNQFIGSIRESYLFWLTVYYVDHSDISMCQHFQWSQQHMRSGCLGFTVGCLTTVRVKTCPNMPILFREL